MAKFKNKKTNQIVEENLNFYIENLRKNKSFEEIKEGIKPSSLKKLKKKKWKRNHFNRRWLK